MHFHSELLGHCPAFGRLRLGADMGRLDPFETGSPEWLQSCIGDLFDDHGLAESPAKSRRPRRQAGPDCDQTGGSGACDVTGDDSLSEA